MKMKMLSQVPKESRFLESLIPEKKERDSVMCQAEELLGLLLRREKPIDLAEGILWVAAMNVRQTTKMYLIYILSRNAGIQHMYEALTPIFEEHGVEVPIIPLDQRDINPIIHDGDKEQRVLY